MFINMAHKGGLQLSVKSLDNAIGGGMPCSRKVREDPVRVARVLKSRASNCLPWSVAICWGQPKRAIQAEPKALATASAVMLERGNA